MLFAIYNLDKPDSLALRAATRPDHLAFLDRFTDRVLSGGAILDQAGQPIGSLIVIEAEDQAAADAIAAEDPYVKAGLFQSVSVRPYRLVYRAGARLG
jgi:uncharacterized protein YciI